MIYLFYVIEMQDEDRISARDRKNLKKVIKLKANHYNLK